MSQVTLYLDEETEALLAAAAAQSGVSRSKWVAEVIRRYASDTWAADTLALAGAFPDFPLRAEFQQSGHAADVPRVGF